MLVITCKVAPNPVTTALCWLTITLQFTFLEGAKPWRERGIYYTNMGNKTGCERNKKQVSIMEKVHETHFLSLRKGVYWWLLCVTEDAKMLRLNRHLLLSNFWPFRKIMKIKIRHLQQDFQQPSVPLKRIHLWIQILELRSENTQPWVAEWNSTGCSKNPKCSKKNITKSVTRYASRSQPDKTSTT